jgi:hypothetical protein
MDERELRLNSLSRYEKVSPLFILEEHGHCEVPAGCGGVVLRWRNPNAGIPFSMRLYSPGNCRLYVDGALPPSSRPVLPFGQHVLAFVVSGFDPEYTVLMFNGVGNVEGDMRALTSADITREAEVLVRTAPDGTWRYTFSEPDDDAWMHPGFDDGGWSAMRRCDPPPIADGENQPAGRYQLDSLTRAGAESLGVRGSASRVWIRKVFELPAPTGTGGQR